MDLYISSPGSRGCPSLKFIGINNESVALNRNSLKWNIESLTEYSYEKFLDRSYLVA